MNMIIHDVKVQEKSKKRHNGTIRKHKGIRSCYGA